MYDSEHGKTYHTIEIRVDQPFYLKSIYIWQIVTITMAYSHPNTDTKGFSALDNG